MIQDIVSTAFAQVMPYLAPTIFIVGAITISDRLRDLVVGAFTRSAGTKRRDDY